MWNRWVSGDFGCSVISLLTTHNSISLHGWMDHKGRAETRNQCLVDAMGETEAGVQASYHGGAVGESNSTLGSGFTSTMDGLPLKAPVCSLEIMLDVQTVLLLDGQVVVVARRYAVCGPFVKRRILPPVTHDLVTIVMPSTCSCSWQWHGNLNGSKMLQPLCWLGQEKRSHDHSHIVASCLFPRSILQSLVWPRTGVPDRLSASPLGLHSHYGESFLHTLSPD